MMRHSGEKSPFGDALDGGIVIFDGAMGTELLPRTDNLLPCEGLNLSRPELVENLHCAYLLAGAQVIRTNSFGANRVMLGRYGLEAQTSAINRAAVAIARRAVGNPNPGRSVLIAGSIGPIPHSVYQSLRTTCSPQAAYAEQARALVEAGAEMLICETFQRLEDVAEVLAAVLPEAREAGRKIPVAVCLTPSGDSEQAADYAASIFDTVIRGSGVDLLGLNCGSGPESVVRPIVNLKQRVSLPLLALPSAGIPIVDGKSLRYPVGIAEFAAVLLDLADRGLVAAVGGCCGTTPAYIAALAKAVGGRAAD